MRNTYLTKASTIALTLLLGLLLVACQPQDASMDENQAEASDNTVENGEASTALNHDLNPLPGMAETVPVITEKTVISFQTTAGEIVIEVYPQAAPNAAARFVELTESGFFNDTPVSRVVTDFVAQFGVNWRDPHKAYQEALFDDDPTFFALERGTLAFAKAGANTNSTQVFINLQENNRLASPQYNFTVFGKIVEGMDVVDSFVQVGDPNGGLDQGRLWNDGEAYLEELTIKPTMIQAARIVD